MDPGPAMNNKNKLVFFNVIRTCRNNLTYRIATLASENEDYVIDFVTDNAQESLNV